MSQRTVFSRLSTRIAEEKQLLAEEKWIIEALNKIRSQRNGLQIERLELESLKTQLMINHRNLLNPDPSPGPSERPNLDSAVKLMTSNPPAPKIPTTELERALGNPLVEEACCNEQELDLTITNPVLSLNYQNFNAEEEDDASDESQDENTSDNMLIDMNMFMNGHVFP